MRLLTKIGTSQQVVKVAICGFCAEKVSDRRPQRVRQFKWGRKTQCGHGINVSPSVAGRPPLNRCGLEERMDGRTGNAVKSCSSIIIELQR